MALVLDTGALIAFERGDRKVAALLEASRRRQEPAVTSSGCVAQAWRDDASRQALLARLLQGLGEQALHPGSSRAVGALCARAGSSDVIDAHLALLAHPGDVVVTSDVDHLSMLLQVRGTPAMVERC